MPSSTDIFIVLAVLAFLALLVLLSKLLARVSGWAKLVQAYSLPTPNPNCTSRVRFQSAQIGLHLFREVNIGLTIGVCEQGLCFSVIMFGWAFRSFFVPWEEIDIAHQTSKEVRLIFLRVQEVPLRISAKTLERIMALAPHNSTHDN